MGLKITEAVSAFARCDFNDCTTGETAIGKNKALAQHQLRLKGWLIIEDLVLCPSHNKSQHDLAIKKKEKR